MSKEPYKGLSRIHRPQTFASVLGQEAIVTTLKNALLQKKTAQAYLFCGTRGTGKTTLARVLAKALNCANLSSEGEPCNTCTSCLEITDGKSLNVFEIDGASNRGIDDIRGLNESVGYAPSSSGCKIFIIDEAHMLTKEAFNALLKTLEEPPPNVKFFLATTEPHKIPPTIISRCQRFDLQRISSAKIAEKLMKITKEQGSICEEEALYKIAGLSDGSMRVAESLLDQILCCSHGPITETTVSHALATLPTEAFFNFDEAFAKNNLKFAFEWASSIFSSGKDLAYFFECLLEHYRNILVIQMQIPQKAKEMSPSIEAKYRHSATIYSEEQSCYILDYLLLQHEQVNKTAFKRVGLEMILLHILKSKYRISAVDLVLRLENLQNGHPEEVPSIKSPSVKKEEITVKPELSAEPIVQKKEVPPADWIEQDLIPVEKPVIAIAPPPPTPAKQVETSSKTEKNTDSQARYDTIMRFASIELEGTLTKE